MQLSYTLATAAAACGVNKSTILRAIKAGKVSAVRDEHGQWQVEPAELNRVYPPVSAATPGTDATQRYVAADAAALALADQRPALAEGRLAELKEMLAERDRNAWRDQAQRLALPKPEASPMSWWRWLRTTG